MPSTLGAADDLEVVARVRRVAKPVVEGSVANVERHAIHASGRGNVVGIKRTRRLEGDPCGDERSVRKAGRYRPRLDHDVRLVARIQHRRIDLPLAVDLEAPLAEQVQVLLARNHVDAAHRRRIKEAAGPEYLVVEE